MWAGFFDQHHREIHERLLANDVDGVAAILRDPATSNVFYGFDGLGLTSESPQNPYRSYSALFILDHLVRFGEAIGAVPLDYPEGYLFVPPRPATTDEILDRIEEKLSMRLRFPNPFPNEYGIESRRGVISYRPPDALYQAWRVASLLEGSTKGRSGSRDRRRARPHRVLRADVRRRRLHDRRSSVYGRVVRVLSRAHSRA